MNENKTSKEFKYRDFVAFARRYEKEKQISKSRKHSRGNCTACYQYKSVFKKGE